MGKKEKTMKRVQTQDVIGSSYGINTNNQQLPITSILNRILRFTIKKLKCPLTSEIAVAEPSQTFTSHDSANLREES